MPGKDIVKDSATGQTCKKCGISEAVIAGRNLPLCRSCFLSYVSSKVTKRLESFRVRHSDPNHLRVFLLPISHGLSSLTLLHILDAQLRSQRARTNRTGYALQLLHVDTSSADNLPPAPASLVQQTQSTYSGYPYTTLPLSSIFTDPYRAYLPDFSSLSVTFPPSADPEAKLQHLLSSLPSPTSRTDLTNLLTRSLIHAFAANTASEGIFYASTTTRLAEAVLAETAKGRGFSIPALLEDGQLAPGSDRVRVYLPLRELLRKELQAHAAMLDPPLTPLVWEPVAPTPVDGRRNTIDALMRTYFEGVETQYPSIVANVVRTGGRLEGLKDEEGERCKCCQGLVRTGELGGAVWGGDQGGTAQGGEGVCYGCWRGVRG